MTARTCPKPDGDRTYLYYACVAGAYQRRDTCSARTHHAAELVEARVWDEVSRILKNPDRVRVGLDHMIEQERRGASLAGDAERWLESISEAGRKRARYQDLAAEGLIDFDELRARLATLEDARRMAEQEVRALQRRTERLTRLEQDRDTLLESYVGLMPEAIDALGSQERYRVYRMIGMQAYLATDGSFDLSGNVMSFSRMEISSS